MKVYINGISAISPFEGSADHFMAPLPVTQNGDRLCCIEPDYDKIFDPSQIRRLSRILKMGLAASLDALNKAGNPELNAIITGTGFGYPEDTARFLHKMVDPEDRGMNPTSFIQSTYNTISSIIALNLKNNGYNNTYVHSGFSFESALDDGIMLLKAGEAENVLIGGIDELTDEIYNILSRLKKTRSRAWKKEMSQKPGKSYLFGEGSSFFIISDRPKISGSIEINHFENLYKPEKVKLESLFKELTTNNNYDLIMLGENDEKLNDEAYNWIKAPAADESFFNYKSLCGDYPTASAFGLWLASSLLTGPGFKGILQEKAENILLYNCFEKDYHLFVSLKRC